MLAVALDVPKPVGPDSSARVNGDPVADARPAVDRDRWIEVHTRAEVDSGAHIAVRPNHGLIANPNAVADDGVRSDGHIAPEHDAAPDDRGGMNPSRRDSGSVKPRQERKKRFLRLVDDDPRRNLPGRF